jgi:Na+/phosphate symporter
MWDTIKEILPWALGIIGTITALKKDWIQNQLSKDKNEIALEVNKEELEAANLDNVEKSLNIFKEMLDTNTVHYQNRIKELEQTFDSTITKLKGEIDELQTLVENQKKFIVKQSKSLDYYERKYGKRTDQSESK